MIPSLENERNDSTAQPSAPVELDNECLKPSKAVLSTIPASHLLKVPNERDKSNSTEFTPNVPQFLTVSPTFSTRFPSLHSSGFNKARHSIDIRALPSYIAKKRQSIFDSKLIDTLVEVATSPFGSKDKSEEKEDDGKPIFEEPVAPTLSLGERVALVKNQGPEFGTVRWIGRMPQISPHWTVGVEFDNAIGSGDGQYDGRRYFTAKENFAKFIPLSSLTKVDNYIGRPRSGTLLSRMSVQLKPGQLISVQRTTSANRLPIQCALNAPHHINHDVHIPNMRHCLCSNCNHPCAHLCRTKKPKGKKSYMSHMCHFSQKPHARMCCGGEELLYALNPKHFDLLTRDRQFYKRQAKHSNFSWTSGDKLFGKRLKSNRTDSHHHFHNHHSHSHHNHRHHLHHNHQNHNHHNHQNHKHHNHHNYHPTHNQLDKSPTCDNPSSLVHLDKNKFGSQLSVSSLPSTTSPCEVFIARGALTDESDLDESDDDYDDDDDDDDDDVSDDNFSGPIRTHKHTLRSDLRSLVLCLVRRKRHKDKSTKSEETQKGTDAFINSSRSNSSRSRNRTKHYDHKNRGLSETPELKVSSYCSHCHSHNAVSASSSTLELDTLRVRSDCSSAPSSLPNLFKPSKTDIKQPMSYTPPLPPPPPPPTTDTMVAKSCSIEDKETSDTSIGIVSNQSSIKSSGQQIVTKAEIETLQSPQTVSAASSHSPRRKRKGPAPAPPTSPSLSSNSKSSKGSAQQLQSFNSTHKQQSKQSASSTSTSTLSATLTLTRSLSERQHNKIKNVLNIFTSCSSEVNLQELAFKAKSKLLVNDLLLVAYDKDDLIYDLFDYDSKVPVKSDLNANELSKDVSVQVNLNCWNHGSDFFYFKSLTDMIISNSNPFRSNFICDQNLNLFHCSSICNHICLNHHQRSSSLPSLIESKFFNSIKNDAPYISGINGAIADVNFRLISKDLAAVLSPKQPKSDSQLKLCNFKHISQSMNKIALDNTIIDGHCHHCFYHCLHHTHCGHHDFNYYYYQHPQARMCVKSIPNIWSAVNSDKEKHTTHLSKHDQSSLPSFAKRSLTNHLEKDVVTTSTLGHSLSLLSSSTLTDDNFDNQTNLKQTCNWSSDSEIGAHPYSKNTKSKLAQKDVLPIFSHLPDNNLNSKYCDYPVGLHEAMFNPDLQPSDCKNWWQDQMNETNIESLMHNLELAIAQGQHKKAASLARQLAFKKVSCRLNQLKHLKKDDQPIIVYLYIKDKSSHKGPIPIQLYSYMTVKQLKLKVQNDFGLPKESQQWIFGKCLATNEDASLATYGINSTGCSIFLYLLSIQDQDVTKSLSNEEPNQVKSEARLAQSQELKDKVEEMNKLKYFDLVSLNNPVGQLKEYVSQETELKLNHDQMNHSFSSNGTMADVIRSNYGTSEAERLNTVQSIQINGSESKANGQFEKKNTIYNDLVILDDLNLVTNCENFECPICLNQTEVGEGVVLRDCLHTFCKKCLVNVIQYSSGPEVKCPFRNTDYCCNSCLQDREVKALVSSRLYQLYLHRSMVAAESKTDKSFHCKTIDCLGWCEYEDNVNLFCCPVCGRQNCLTCQAIHENMDCKQYQDQLNNEAEQNEEAKITKQLLEKMLTTNEALRCPCCKVIVIKKWGCDWIKCSMCKTEICWVTKGPRWGPKGRGDTSGGCKCMINGQRCHPKCSYCH